jgi:Site-specific recombinase XerD
MEGSLKHYNGDTWHYTVTLEPHLDENGKRIYPRKKFTIKAKNITEARAEAAKKLVQVNSGKFLLTSSDPTLGEYADRWLKEGQRNWAKGTYTFYERRVRLYIKPELELIKLSKLRTRHIKGLLNGLQDNKSKQAAASTYRTLHAMLQQAVYDDDVDFQDNIADKLPPPEVDEKEMIVWDADQVKLFLAEARKKGEGVFEKFHQAIEKGDKVFAEEFSELFWWWNFYLVCLANFSEGFRINEALGLKWAVIDTENMKIQVKEKLETGTAGKNPEFGKPKNKKGTLSIPLVELLGNELKLHRTLQNEIQLAHKNWRKLDLVFTLDDGGPLDLENFRKRKFYPLFKEINLKLVMEKKEPLPRIRIHDMRHSCATMLYDAGVPLEIIQDILRHSTPVITKTLYIHRKVNPQHKIAAQKMNELLK